VAVVGDYTNVEPPDRLVSTLDDLLRYIWMQFPQMEDVAAHSEIDPNYPHCPGSFFAGWVTALRLGRQSSPARHVARVSVP
jgi:N-acetyl-anhydromuramyl-L-alanine amidase AmpD